ncbi:hypothetical protein [Gemmatimonas sp.]|uniref:hypothetical protein n=1 Tax=Gemmatimonas sp. TaxID=1962908 RepID=UPI0035658363
MPLCGSSTCGCAVTSTPATSGAINGFFPSITVAGNGTPVSPWLFNLNPDWAGAAATHLNNQTNRLACHTSRSGAQTIANDVATAVLFDVETFDVGGLHSNSVNPDRITCPAGGGGLYLLCYTVTFDTQATRWRAAWMSRNGSTGDRHGITVVNAVTGSNVTSLCGTTIQRMVPGDYFRVIASQSSQFALNVLGNATAAALTTFAATRLGD